jgi:uncharacterized membrane protein YesL
MSENRHRQSSEVIDRITSFILVNMLWMVLSVPVITMPLATAGLFATITPWVRGGTSEPFRAFFGAMRQYALKSIAIFLCDIVIAMIVLANLQILSQMASLSIPALLSLNVTIFIAASAILTNLYIWPLLVTVDVPLPRLIKVAAKVALLHPLWSAFVALLAMVPLLVSLVLPRFVALISTFSTCALLASWGAWRVLEKYVDGEQLKGL